MHTDAAESISWDDLEEHAEILRAYLARHCRDLSQADDVAQDALVRAARFRTRVQDARNLRGWILRIGASVLRDHQRSERRLHLAEGGEELLSRREAPDPEPGQWSEEELLMLEGQVVEREQLMSEMELALEETEERDRIVLARLYGAGLCREGPGQPVEEVLSAKRRKERLWRARQRLHRRLCSRVRVVVRSGDEFTPARLAATCTGGGAFALPPEEPKPGARRAQRG